MCVHVRRNYRVAQLTRASGGAFAAAAVLNVLTPADWSVSQEVELAVAGLAATLRRQVPVDVEAALHVVVHANHIEVLVECEHPAWVTEGVRVRPRRPFETAVECAVERPGPPPARPALWPELARPRGREEWADTYAALARILQSVRGGATDLAPILNAIARGVVATTCFTVVATNLVVPGGVEVVSVVGDEDARNLLLGVVEPERHWRELVARGTSWGSLRYSAGDTDLPPNTVMTSWRPPVAAGGSLNGWDPRGTLVAPLYIDGRFIGALSVDLPGGAPRPSAEDLSKLEVYAEHAAMAIERARVAR